MSHVNLKLLQTFLLVAEHSSFRIAAEHAYRSQSAVSAQIRILEKQLQVSLFHRTTRSVRLTSEGMQLLECAQRGLMEVELGLRSIRESADVRRGKVSLSCSPTIAQSRLARVLAAFESDYPSIEIRVRELASSEIYESVRKREVDFGIGPSVETREFQFEHLFEDEFYALIPKRFLATTKTTIPLAKLAAIPLLVLSSATALRSSLEASMKEWNLTFTTKYEFVEVATLISMASAGLGAAILPGVAVPPCLSDEVHCARIVNPSLHRQIALITLKGQSLSPASLRLVHLMKQLIPEPEDSATVPRRT
ncbi:LysR substrate-binding domain-containing protein [Aminobacter sp. MSH1]|uniref:LysR family transcriptional regulator n=1 Tax=Aminobacter sp. MSH1 TaxID=374606 RepID=UPI00131ED522|nr:LysR substrate-binding domain-containing protein [Aminobacter sp. MSH1]